MYPVAVAKVAEALGGERMLGGRVSDMTELAAAVARGLPREVVRELAASAAHSSGSARGHVAALVTSPASLKRGLRLSPAASERAERLARVTALARQALGDDDEARTWLTETHPMLGRPPIDLAAMDLGARQVERLLHDIEYSLPA
jgi:putative toxin-antitoxin system antitoxin component (TIGR02293 family)